ncbi:hypothetical protein CR513_26804, partial [Mucuna pruriens]
MPRRGSGGRSARSSPRPAPRPVNHAPPPAPAQSGNRGSLFGTIAEGMAFGGGSAMAHRAVDSVLGPRTIQHETVATGPPAADSFGGEACNVHSKAFQDRILLKVMSLNCLQCLNSYGSDINKCQFYMDMLAECRRNSGATLSA